MFGKVFWYLELATLVASLVAEADACHRCGRSQCVYAAPAYVAPVVATPTVNTYVINSNYPAPLVAGGTSAVVSTGGYQSQVLPLFDPQTYLSSSIELQKAVNGTMSLAFQQGNALAQRSLELQSPAVERLAAGQTASMVLQAAGLEPGKGATAGAQSFVFRRESNGAFHMEPLTTEQVERITLKVEAGTSAATATPDEISADAKFPLVVKFCAKCHGPDLAAPKGGVYLGDSDNAAKWQRDNFFEIVQQIKKGSMPPASSPQPTQDERAGLLSEFESIINSRLGGAP